MSASVLALDVWSHYLAIGSNVVQMVDLSSDELRRIVFMEDTEGIPVREHLLAYYDFLSSQTIVSLIYFHFLELHIALPLCCIYW